MTNHFFISKFVKDMEKKTWLTVIIPIYNGQDYLKECLQSIASQTFENYEVVLVDDESTDASPEICQKFCAKDTRFQYYRIENSGALFARVFGARLVKSQYFTFCDADDYYIDKNVFSKLYEKTSALSTIKAHVVQFGYKKKYNHLSQKVRFVQQDCYVDKSEFYMREYPKLLCSFWDQSHLSMNVWNKLYSCELLTYLPSHSKRVFWGDDLIINIHLLQAIQGIYYLPDVLYVYRQFTGGTSRFSLYTMNDLDTIKEYQLSFLQKIKPENADILRRILFSEMAGWFLGYLREARDHVDKDELRRIVVNTLELPRFKLAQQYYKENPEDWEGARLLMNADVEEYIKSANIKSQKTLKTALIQVLKSILKKL